MRTAVWSIHSSTQTLDGVQSAVARALGIPCHAVTACKPCCHHCDNDVILRFRHVCLSWQMRSSKLICMPIYAPDSHHLWCSHTLLA